MVVRLPLCPSNLRSIQPYLKIASEHDDRDPIVSYWCRLYSLQTALNIDKKSDEAKAFLLSLMDWLEETKRLSNTNESITSEVAAQAYIENYVLKLFVWADNMDRSANFNKNVVKSFYTSGMLLDVLTVFGELNEELSQSRKYAKWKAAYIHNCLKNGETPVSGPMYAGTEEENELNELLNFHANKSDIPNNKNININNISDSENKPIITPQFSTSEGNNGVSHNLSTPTSEFPQPISDVFTSSSNENVKLDATQITKAQKYCKFASSALNYEDIPEAISNLQKALQLLKEGKE